jgi:hypothetical protein
MATSIEPAVLALAGTVVGGLISFTTTAWAERRRSREARAFLNHAERKRAAAEYLAAFDGYRRYKRYGGSGGVELSRAHASAIVLLGLYFDDHDDHVVEAAERAADCIEKIEGSGKERESADTEAKNARDEVISLMKTRLGEGKSDSWRLMQNPVFRRRRRRSAA